MKNSNSIAIQTLVSFTKNGGNVWGIFQKSEATRSSYHSHYRDGDSDNQIEGLDTHAPIGEVVGDLVCVYTYITPRENRGWDGCTTSSWWVSIETLLEKAPLLTPNFAALSKEGVNIQGSTPSLLALLPINWVELLGEFNGISSMHSYYFGSDCAIVVCENYITITGEYSSNSCVSMRGYTYTKPVGQFLLDGTDNTKPYKAFVARQKRADRIEALVASGLTLEQAKIWDRVKGQWKHELCPFQAFKFAAELPFRKVWEKAAAADGYRSMNKVLKTYLGRYIFSDYSFPRSTSFMAIIAQLCRDNRDISEVTLFKGTTIVESGDGWALIRE